MKLSYLESKWTSSLLKMKIWHNPHKRFEEDLKQWNSAAILVQSAEESAATI